MTSKQQKALVNLTGIFAQFGVVFVEQTHDAAYFQAPKTAPLEKRHVELMASKFKSLTGLKFMLKPVDNF